MNFFIVRRQKAYFQRPNEILPAWSDLFGLDAAIVNFFVFSNFYLDIQNERWYMSKALIGLFYGLTSTKKKGEESDEKKEREFWFCPHSRNEYLSFISRNIVLNILKSILFIFLEEKRMKRVITTSIVIAFVL